MDRLRFHPCGSFNERYEQELTIFQTDFGRLWVLMGLVVLFAVVPFVCKPYTLYIINLIGIASIAAIGLNILVGFKDSFLGNGAFSGRGLFRSHPGHLSDLLSNFPFFLPRP